MVTYSENILPRCLGIASCARQQNDEFTRSFLNTEVKYFDKKDEPAKVTHPQRLDDLYGTFTSSLAVPLPSSMSDKNKKRLIQTCLDQYHAKQDSARAYLELAAARSGIQKPYDRNVVGWFDRTQKILEELIQGLQTTLNNWKL